MSNSVNTVSDGSSITKNFGTFGALKSLAVAVQPDDVLTVKDNDWTVGWMPTYSTFGAVAITPVPAQDNARYQIQGKVVEVFLAVGITTSAMASAQVVVNLPTSGPLAMPAQAFVGLSTVHYTNGAQDTQSQAVVLDTAANQVGIPFAAVAISPAELVARFNYVLQ